MSKFIESTLLNNESIVYQARLSLWNFAARITFAAIALINAILNVSVNHTPSGYAWTIGIALLVWCYLEYKNSEFVITNQRILIKVGWLKLRSFELLLSKIESISVNQTLLFNLSAIGTIVIKGVGGSNQIFKGINNPLEFRKQAQVQLQPK